MAKPDDYKPRPPAIGEPLIPFEYSPGDPMIVLKTHLEGFGRKFIGLRIDDTGLLAKVVRAAIEEHCRPETLVKAARELAATEIRQAVYDEVQRQLRGAGRAGQYPFASVVRRAVEIAMAELAPKPEEETTAR